MDHDPQAGYLPLEWRAMHVKDLKTTSQYGSWQEDHRMIVSSLSDDLRSAVMIADVETILYAASTVHAIQRFTYIPTIRKAVRLD